MWEEFVYLPGWGVGMSKAVRWSSFVLVSILSVSFLAAADEKPDPKGKLENKERLISAGEVTGKLVRVESSAKTLAVQVEFQQVEMTGAGVARPNPANTQAAQEAYRRQQETMRQMQDMMRQQQEIMRIQDPRERASRMQQMMTRMQQQQMQQQMQQRQIAASTRAQQAPQQSPFRMVTKKQDLDIQAADEVKVRVQYPPPGFDDKGNPKKYSPEELKKLKGPNPSLPGYVGDFEELRPGMLVKVSLARKPQAKAAVKPKDKDKDEWAAENKPLATMIIVLGDVPDPLQANFPLKKPRN